MKTFTTLILVAVATIALADTPTTLTITIPPEDEPRIAEAFGSILGLGRPATPQEVEQAAIVWLDGQTRDYERRKDMQAFSPPPLTLSSPQPAGSPIPGKAAPKKK